jgi:hypothetical protein
MKMMTRNNPQKKEQKTVQAYDGSPVLFDVWPWLEANMRAKDFVVNGPFRIANALNTKFWPAILVENVEESEHVFDWRILLSQALGKQIEVVILSEAEKHPFRAWISLGMDYTSPWTKHLPDLIVRIAVLHDVMAAEGVFGEKNQATFYRAMIETDWMLYVSETTCKRFLDIEQQMPPDYAFKELIHFPNCHHYGDKAPDFEKIIYDRRMLRSMSLHTLFRRKNIFRTLEVSNELLLNHRHFGRWPCPSDFTEEEKITWEKQIDDHLISWVPGGTDGDILNGMLAAQYFICSSEDEGFSMPPMEAIICGVPYVLLSDIPVHREIYGEYGVNFFSTKIGDPLPSKPLKRVTEEDRLKIFQKHSIENMLAPLLNQLHAHAIL